MTTLHVGAAGELLVQYVLLKHDIDSARLTTDSGVDLVVYSPDSSQAFTLQVKTSAKSGRSVGSGSSPWDGSSGSTSQLSFLL